MNHDTSTATETIRFDDITKVYSDGTEAVSDVSFSVSSGETATLVGPSGCGKTTTMKMVNALVEPTAGEIVVNGTPVSEYDPIEIRRTMGYVIQDIGLFKHMTIEENIGIVPDIMGWDEGRIDDRVTELLELVRLGEDVRTNYPQELSGGQQQRVGVARALAAEPEVMLMDEPFGALDPITREQLQDEFLRIQEGLDVTIVFVTHDIDEALKMGDKVAVMQAGELVQYDPPAQLLRNPANSFVESFLGEDRQLAQLQTVFVREVMGAADAAPADYHGTPLAPGDTLRLAVQTWLQSDIDHVPVVDDDTVVGSISEAHLRSVFEETAQPIEENHV